ncbi:MAG TPA: HD domain-containing protein [Bacillota bacterium]
MLVRDPVHGDIYLTRVEADLLDAVELQRLRGIKQTGTAYLIYPGCLHTRFDHSLGTLRVAKQILDNLRHKGFGIDPWAEAVVTAAALIHDVGHIPFGHTLEDEAGLFPRHDRARRLEAFLTGTDLARRLRAHGLLEPVRMLLEGRDHPNVEPWMRQVVTSTVDADMLDYLRRDAYFSGLRHQYDDRILSCFVIDQGRLAVDLFKHGVERTDVRSDVIHLLRLRYLLTERIYLHHTKVIAGAMLAKGVERLVAAGLREADLYGWQDADLLAALRRDGDDAARRLAEAVTRRRLLKRAYVLAPPHVDAAARQTLIARYAGPGNAARRSALERDLARELGLEDGEVILHCPERSMFKEVKVLVTDRGGGLTPLDALNEPTVSEVRTLARQYRDLWRFYVLTPAGAARRARELCREIFGLPSSFEPAAAQQERHRRSRKA